MRIRMRTMLAGPAGVLHVGQVADLEPATAKALIAGGYAEAVHQTTAKAPEDHAGSRTETADVEPEEDATRRHGDRRPRGRR
jgi:hypothetical protein